jgi:hypothetical protein
VELAEISNRVLKKLFGLSNHLRNLIIRRAAGGLDTLKPLLDHLFQQPAIPRARRLSLIAKV